MNSFKIILAELGLNLTDLTFEYLNEVKDKINIFDFLNNLFSLIMSKEKAEEQSAIMALEIMAEPIDWNQFVLHHLAMELAHRLKNIEFDDLAKKCESFEDESDKRRVIHHLVNFFADKDSTEIFASNLEKIKEVKISREAMFTAIKKLMPKNLLSGYINYINGRAI